MAWEALRTLFASLTGRVWEEDSALVRLILSKNPAVAVNPPSLLLHPGSLGNSLGFDAA